MSGITRYVAELLRLKREAPPGPMFAQYRRWLEDETLKHSTRSTSDEELQEAISELARLERTALAYLDDHAPGTPDYQSEEDLEMACRGIRFMAEDEQRVRRSRPHQFEQNVAGNDV